MKNRNSWLRTFALFALVGFTLTSCRMDDENYNELLPVEVTDVAGSYEGKTVIKHDLTSQTFSTKFVAESDSIKIEDVALNQIVSSLITDPIEAKEALEGLDPVNLMIGYKGELASEGKEVRLDLAVQPLEFVLPIDGVDKTILVHFADKGYGSFYATNVGEELYLGFVANKIEVNGEAIATMKEFSFLIGGIKK